MISIKEWMELVDYRITEGSEYGWRCFGDKAYSLDSWNGIHDDGGWSSNIVFDRDTQTVFEVYVCDYTNDRAYRIIHEDYLEAYKKDADVHNSDWSNAWDGVNFVDLESDDDFIQKTLAIKEGKDYDTRVSIPLELPEDELFRLMKLAHERDITLNELVEEALKEAIKEFQRDPEGLRRRAKAWADSGV